MKRAHDQYTRIGVAYTCVCVDVSCIQTGRGTKRSAALKHPIFTHYFISYKQNQAGDQQATETNIWPKC